MEARKGDIFFAENNKTGKEIPVLIVSNYEVTNLTGCAQVVFLTDKEEHHFPTHVEIMCKTPSIALCERMGYIYKDQLREWIRRCTDDEMKEIDNAIMWALEIKAEDNMHSAEELNTLEKELAEKTQELETLKKKELEERKNDVDTQRWCEENIRTETERDTYKTLYKNLLEKVVEKIWA